MGVHSLWVIFSFSFIVALSGAMVPGPLMTYTIVRTIESKRMGFLMGVWVIAGHALLESAVVITLLLGFSAVLRNQLATRIIGTVGGVFLLYMGVRIVVDTLRKSKPQSSQESKASRGIGHPVLGGVLVSMSNPYWWFWWASIGFAFMLQYEISFQNWQALAAFFLGHEAGDLLWYTLISVLTFLGRRQLNGKVYAGVLFCCGVVMIGFGFYLGISPFTR